MGKEWASLAEDRHPEQCRMQFTFAVSCLSMTIGVLLAWIEQSWKSPFSKGVILVGIHGFYRVVLRLVVMMPASGSATSVAAAQRVPPVGADQELANSGSESHLHRA
eukprot:6483715-Amphidinium_carterae.1